MTKQIITAETVRLAWKAGQSVVTCAPGDIVTQQAQDDIRYYGMQLHTEAPAPVHQPAPAPVSAKTPVEAVAVALAQTPSGHQPKPSPALTADQLAAATRQLQEVLVPLTQALTASVQPAPQEMPPVVFAPGVNPMAASSPTKLPEGTEALRSEQTLIAAIRRKVLAALPSKTVDDALLDQLIKTVFAEIGTSCGAGSRAVEIRPGVMQAGGVVHVDSKKQLWSSAGGKDSVSMMEVLSPADGAAAAVGYLEWEKLSFSWTFTRPEVLVVLEGELTLTIEGTTFDAAPGDVFSIPGGTDVVLGSAGHVKCTTVGVAA